MTRQSNRIKVGAPLIGGVLVAALLAGCASGTPPVAEPPEDANTPERSSMNIGYNLAVDPSNIPDLAAFECLAEDFGVEANVNQIQGAPASITSLIGGAVDITLSTMSAGINAIVSGGQDIVAFVPSASAPYFTLMAPASVDSWEDFKGLNVGITGFTDSSYYTTVLQLEKYGLSADDVTWITVQGGAARAQAMAAGRIDAGQVSVLQAITLQDNPSLQAWADVANDFPELLFSAYWVKRDYLEENPNMLRAFVSCLMTEHREAAQKDLYMEKAKRILGNVFNEAETSEAYDRLFAMGIWDPNESRWNGEAGNYTIGLMAEYEAVEKFIPFSDWAVTDVVDKVRDELGPFEQPAAD